MVDIEIVALVILVIITIPDHLENGVIEIKALVKEVEETILQVLPEVKEGNNTKIPDPEVGKVSEAQGKVNKFVERKSLEMEMLLKKMKNPV